MKHIIVRLSILTCIASGLIYSARPTLAWAPESTHFWPMMHGNYNHSGYADVNGPANGTLKWRFKAASGEDGAPPPNSMAIDADGIIYVGAPERVYALKPDGSVKWKKRYTSVQGPALSADGKTVYIAGNNAVFALKAKNGEKKWKYAMGSSTLFGPTIAVDGTIYQGSWDHFVYALHPDGSLKWRFETAGAVSYPITLNKKGTVLVGGGDAHEGPDPYLYALNPNTGAVKWQYDTGATRVGSPAVGADNLIYVPAAPALFVLDKDGVLQWSAGDTDVTPDDGGGDILAEEVLDNPVLDTPAEESSDVAGIISPAIGPDGTVYIGNSQGLISAIDPNTQEVKWTYQTGVSLDGSGNYGLPSFPVVDKKGRVYFGSVDGNMYALSKDGELLWAYQTDNMIAEAAPALDADGTLYFSSDDGYVYAIQDE